MQSTATSTVKVTEFDKIYYRGQVRRSRDVDVCDMGTDQLDRAFANKVMNWVLGPDNNSWFQREPYQATGWVHQLKDVKNEEQQQQQHQQRWCPSANMSHTIMALQAVRDTTDEKHRNNRIWMDYEITPFTVTFFTYKRSEILVQMCYDQDRYGATETCFAMCAYLAICEARRQIHEASKQGAKTHAFSNVPVMYFSIRRGEASAPEHRFNENASRKRRALMDYYDIADKEEQRQEQEQTEQHADKKQTLSQQ